MLKIPNLKAVVFFLFCINLIFFAGCSTLAPVGFLVGGVPKSAYKSIIFALSEDSPPDTMNIVAGIGKSMGFSIKLQTSERLVLSYGTGFGSEIVGDLFGKVNVAMLDIYFTEVEKGLLVKAELHANFTDAGKEIERIINEFRSKLSEKIRIKTFKETETVVGSQ